MATLILLAAMVGETYSEAREASIENGKPLVVLVCASWCAPCRELGQRLARADLSSVHFCKLDIDRQPMQAAKVRRSALVPELVIYARRSGRWKSWRRIGLQSPSQLAALLREAKEYAQ